MAAYNTVLIVIRFNPRVINENLEIVNVGKMEDVKDIRSSKVIVSSF